MPAPDDASAAELTTLLCRGLSRLAMASQGSDDRLDSLLAELRHFLRGDLREVAQLAQLVPAIEQRIRELDRGDPAAALRFALDQLVGTLRELPTAAPDLSELQSRLGTARLSEMGELVNQLAASQRRALGPLAGRHRRWRDWFGGRSRAPDQAGTHPSPDVATERYSELQRLLLELLRQLEPPPLAADSYQQAQARLESGLDHANLGATLEDICQVVVAALEHDRGEFQRFLLMLNQRLLEAHTALAASRECGRERAAASEQLQQTVAAEVTALEAGLAVATSLEGLKAEVTQRLNTIVSSLATHRCGETAREAELQQQLEQLGAHIAQLEEEAVRLEQRMEEQRRLALLDTLTQLPNRQAYEERLQQEWTRSRRHGRALTLALCDIDNFKSINDRFGHLAGDKVLRVVARALRGRLRRSDFCARFGGEEFVLLLPETDAVGALQILEAIRLAVAACPFRFRDQPVAITLSAGIADLASVADCTSPEQLFRLADEALYRAKQAGRNRCEVVAPPPVAPASPAPA